MKGKIIMDTTISDATLITTKEAAQILGVAPRTIASWRERKLFGVPFFTADAMKNGAWFYERERVEQLKAVYHKGILGNMYKLARKFKDVEVCPFDICGTRSYLKHLEKIPPKYLFSDEVAQVLEVTEKTLSIWRDNGTFVEDVQYHDGTFGYLAERVYAKKAAGDNHDETADNTPPDAAQDTQSKDSLIAEMEEAIEEFAKLAISQSATLTLKPKIRFYRQTLTKLVARLKADSMPFPVLSTDPSVKLADILKEAGLPNANITEKFDEFNGEDVYTTWIVKDIDEVKKFFRCALKYLESEISPSGLSLKQRKALFSGDDTDLDNACRIAFFYKNQLRYVPGLDVWATYDGAKWILGEDGKSSSVYPYVRKLADKMKDAAKDDKERKFAKKFASMKKISPAISFMKGIEEIFIKQQDLDTHKNLLNCKNGVVDLETKKLYPHDPDLLLTQQVHAEYKPAHHNDVVDNFFKTILPDEETRLAFLRFLGYGLTGEINEEKALFIFGGGGNGKGTLTQSLLRLIGNYAMPFPIKAILQRYQTKDCNAATPVFSQLEYKRLAIAEEIPKGERLDIAQFKLLTGGDQLPVRKLHHELSVITDPTHKMIFSGNHLPELDDARDFGLIRRLLVIRFTQTFNADNCDVNLKHKLLQPDALSGLLSLLVDNAAQWYQDGLLSSSAMVQTKNDYLRQEDFVAEFIDENCVVTANGVIPLKDFLNRLRDNSIMAKRMTDRALRDTVSRTLAAMQGVEKKKLHGGIYKIVGLGWLADNTDGFGDDFAGDPIPDSAVPF